MHRAVATIRLDAECHVCRLRSGNFLEERNRESKATTKATLSLAYDVYGKLYDHSMRDRVTAEMKVSRDFFIGWAYGATVAEGDTEGEKRFTAQTKDMRHDDKSAYELAALHLYRERNCDLLPRAAS